MANRDIDVALQMMKYLIATIERPGICPKFNLQHAVYSDMLAQIHIERKDPFSARDCFTAAYKVRLICCGADAPTTQHSKKRMNQIKSIAPEQGEVRLRGIV